MPGRVGGHEVCGTDVGSKPEVMRGEKGTGTPVAGKVMEMGAREAEWTAGWLVRRVVELERRVEARAEGTAAGQSLEA